MKLKELISVQLSLEQALHSAVLCLSQGSEEELAMTLQLVHWSFLNVTQDTSSMAPEPLGVTQCLIRWLSGMIPYLLALVSVSVCVLCDCAYFWVIFNQRSSFSSIIKNVSSSYLHCLYTLKIISFSEKLFTFTQYPLCLPLFLVLRGSYLKYICLSYHP